mmetsp:Transcript_15140/g.16843  ORF Transcript_15140/g.16843 Transcript_15140/m.16843 type:complete len:219 (+) Transcript_15140:195-851(+)
MFYRRNKISTQRRTVNDQMTVKLFTGYSHVWYHIVYKITDVEEVTKAEKKIAKRLQKKFAKILQNQRYTHDHIQEISSLPEEGREEISRLLQLEIYEEMPSVIILDVMITDVQYIPKKIMINLRYVWIYNCFENKKPKVINALQFYTDANTSSPLYSAIAIDPEEKSFVGPSSFFLKRGTREKMRLEVMSSAQGGQRTKCTMLQLLENGPPWKDSVLK